MASSSLGAGQICDHRSTSEGFACRFSMLLLRSLSQTLYAYCRMTWVALDWLASIWRASGGLGLLM